MNQPAPAAMVMENEAAKPSVLLIEDNEDGREMMATMLDVYGYPVLQSADGLDGVSLATAHLPRWRWSTSTCPASTVTRLPGACAPTRQRARCASSP
ncbi:hypothetical protein [Massilia sp. Dwa41.01b]|uniref:hypothetical protein n=1 Tax=Massilia sp. Dwa41.01b TaxID=2709302 RepID=UPI0035A5A8A2